MAITSDRAALVARFTAPGQPFELAEQVVRGVPMRVYTGTPQTLRDIALALPDFGDLPFLVYRDERWTYAEQARTIAALAHRLATDYGLRKGDRIAVSMRNYPEWIPIFFATQLLGAILVPLNAWWTAGELAFALDDAGVSLVVADEERAALVAPRLGGIPMIEVRGGDRPAPGARSWAELMGDLDPSATAPESTVDPDDDSTILYTSGTTGRPKGAICTHRNHCTNLRNTALAALVSATIKNSAPDPNAPQLGGLCTFPLFHIAGISGIGYAAMTGAKLATQYRWDRDEARELIRRERLTGVSGVPTVLRELVADAAAHPDDYTTLIGLALGGTSVPPDLIGRIGRDLAVAPTNGYGSTETTSTVVYNTGADYLARPDSVGRPQPGTDVRVVDPADGRDLPDGEVGELWFRGPNIMRGYWNNPEATAESLTDGWFHTGDLGRVVDGWVHVVDRLKDVVIRGGENIYCAEVEATLFTHPAIEDVAIVGVPHESLGEVPVAIVVPRAGATVTAEDVRSHVAGRLARFTVPAHVVFWPGPLPRTQTGKVLKRDLRAAVLAKVAAG